MAQPVPTTQPGVGAIRRRASELAKSRRGLRAIIRFPVAFRSGLDSAPFRVLSLSVLFYAVAPNLEGIPPHSAMPEAGNAKYLFTIAVTLCAALLAMRTPRLNLSPPFLLAPLALFVLGSIAFAYSIFFAPGLATYSSGLIPLIIIAIPLLIATRGTRADGAAVREYLLAIFGVAALCHVLWQVAAGWVGATEDYDYGWVFFPQGSIVFVYFMLLSGLFRRNLSLAFSIGLIGLNLLLRPSSTLVFTTMFAAAVIVSHRLRLQRFFRVACLLVAALIIVGNLAVLESDDVAQALYSIEPLIKQDALGANSNNQDRLALISAARYELLQYWLLIGKAFSGKVTVATELYLPWLWSQGVMEMPIHSDFIIMIVEGGLIGYGLFASIFLGMALLCAKAARFARAVRDSNSEILFDAFQAMNITFMFYMSGNPTMLLTQVTVPCYLLPVSLAVFLARAQPGFAEPRRRPSGPRPGGTNLLA